MRRPTSVIEGRPSGFSVEAMALPGAAGVAVRGEVDRDTADRLRVALRHAVSTTGIGRLTVDLAAVPLVDAAGVAVLIDAASAASVAEVALSLRGAQPYVARILTVSGLASLLDDRER